jgi:hypothetical protein
MRRPVRASSESGRVATIARVNELSGRGTALGDEPPQWRCRQEAASRWLVVSIAMELVGSREVHSLSIGAGQALSGRRGSVMKERFENPKDA